jgi:predicted enzyme related to lactoylglutathione lyase
MPEPFFKKIDCVELHVNDLDEALRFYRDRLGHALEWRSDTAAGLRLADSDGEIVLQTEREGMNVDFLVPSADMAAQEFERAGGTVLVRPFDIQIGRCVVVRDPWGNKLVLLDMSKGRLVTDAEGRIIGNETPG